MMTRDQAYLILNSLPRVGPVTVRNLLQKFDSPEQLLTLSKADLRGLGLNEPAAASLATWEEQVDVEAEEALARELGVTMVHWESPLYPPMLKEIHDPPLLLYVQGELLEKDRHAVGVVGSRKPSHYGLQCAKKLSFQLAHAGLTVVSGLARGIDTAAHQAALASHGRTVAVIGSGLAELYPPENRPLADKIAEQGAVVSEFPLRTKPDRQTFPMRNRIISGWGPSLLVVEAGRNSGALISAAQAADQGRGVYAVPGPIDRPTCHGSNQLIQQGAKLIMSASDILEDLSILVPPGNDQAELTQSRPQVELNKEEQALYDAFGDDETPIDDLIAKSGLPSQKVSSTLLRLEMKRLVKALPGKFYVKLL